MPELLRKRPTTLRPWDAINLYYPQLYQSNIYDTLQQHSTWLQ